MWVKEASYVTLLLIMPSALQRPSKLRSAIKYLLFIGLLLLPYTKPGSYVVNIIFFRLVIFAVILACLYLYGQFKHKWPLPYGTILKFMLILLGVKLLTTFTSILPIKSLLGHYGMWADSFAYFLAVMLIAIVTMGLFLKTKEQITLIKLLLLQATIFASVTLAQAIHGGLLARKAVRPVSVLGNSDYMLSFLLLVWPVALCLFIYNLGLFGGKKTKLAIVYGLQTLVISFALFLCLPTNLQSTVLPGYFRGSLVDPTSISQIEPKAGIGSFLESEANVERFSQWKFGIIIGMQNPLVGTGPSNSAQSFYLYQDKLDLSRWDQRFVMARPHNDLIEQFSQSGILGLGAYLAFWIVFWRLIIKSRAKIPASTKPYYYALSMGLGLYLLFNIFLFTTPYAGVVSWVWIALLVTMTGQLKATILPAITRLRLLCLGLLLFPLIYVYSMYYLAEASHRRAIYQRAYAVTIQDETLAAEILKSAWTHDKQAAYYVPFDDTFIRYGALSNFALSKDVSDDAIPYLERAVSINPYKPSNWIDLGMAQYFSATPGSDQQQTGIQHINRGLALQSKMYGNYLYVAATLTKAKVVDHQLADSYYQLALKNVIRKDVPAVQASYDLFKKLDLK